VRRTVPFDPDAGELRQFVPAVRYAARLAREREARHRRQVEANGFALARRHRRELERLAERLEEGEA